ncbi:Uncharacterized protein PBTT_03617 [Plasmodiophora brassicae]
MSGEHGAVVGQGPRKSVWMMLEEVGESFVKDYITDPVGPDHRDVSLLKPVIRSVNILKACKANWTKVVRKLGIDDRDMMVMEVLVATVASDEHLNGDWRKFFLETEQRGRANGSEENRKR